MYCSMLHASARTTDSNRIPPIRRGAGNPLIQGNNMCPSGHTTNSTLGFCTLGFCTLGRLHARVFQQRDINPNVSVATTDAREH